MSSEWVLVSSLVVAIWTVLATIVAIATKITRGHSVPNALQTTFVAFVLFLVLFYLPLEHRSGLSLWVVLAPTLSIAMMLVVIAWLVRTLRPNKNVQDEFSFALALQITTSALILINCYWVVAFDQSLRN